MNFVGKITCTNKTLSTDFLRQHATTQLKVTVKQQNAPLSPHLHEALALQFVHPVGGAVQPLPL